MTEFTKLFIVACLLSCTVRGQVAEEHKNMLMRCTDSRNDEVFLFNTDDVKDIRVGTDGPVSVELTDTEGRERHILKTEEAWIKCVPHKTEQS